MSSSLSTRPRSPRRRRKSASRSKLSPRSSGSPENESDGVVPVRPQVEKGLAEAGRAVGDHGREAVSGPDEGDGEAGPLETEGVAPARVRAQGRDEHEAVGVPGPHRHEVALFASDRPAGAHQTARIVDPSVDAA